jgi:hypothetical protein
VPTLTHEQIRTLAPDASAARSGEALADRRRWDATGRSDVAAWGLCKGSGATPYQVVVDIVLLIDVPRVPRPRSRDLTRLRDTRCPGGAAAATSRGVS